MMTGLTFPGVRARNLESLDANLPEAFDGARNVVAIAFRRQHQDLVDSWVPWFEAQAAGDQGLRFYEVPVIGRIWAPVRRFIDGGMAAAIRTPAVLRRTFTVYGDVTRVTGPLCITDTSTIAVACVDRKGNVLWMGRGGFSSSLARELEAVLTAHRQR